MEISGLPRILSEYWEERRRGKLAMERWTHGYSHYPGRTAPRPSAGLFSLSESSLIELL